MRGLLERSFELSGRHCCETSSHLLKRCRVILTPTLARPCKGGDVGTPVAGVLVQKHMLTCYQLSSFTACRRSSTMMIKRSSGTTVWHQRQRAVPMCFSLSDDPSCLASHCDAAGVPSEKRIQLPSLSSGAESCDLGYCSCVCGVERCSCLPRPSIDERNCRYR